MSAPDLFGHAPPAPERRRPKRVRRKPAVKPRPLPAVVPPLAPEPALTGAVWRLEPHVCLACYGRIASRKDGEGRLYRCTNCGAQGLGSVRSICGCGSRVNRRDAGLRCRPNPHRSPENPAEFVLMEEC